MSHRQLKKRSSFLLHVPLSLPQSKDIAPLNCTLGKVRHPSHLTLLNKGRAQGLHREKDNTRNRTACWKLCMLLPAGQMASRSWGRNKGAGPHNHASAGNITDLLRSFCPTLCSSRWARAGCSGLCPIRCEYLQGRSLHDLSGGPALVLDHPHPKKAFSYVSV